MVRKFLAHALALLVITLLFVVASSYGFISPASAETISTTFQDEEILLAQSLNFPLKGSKHTELGDHRRMATDITISNNGRIDGVTRTWTDKQWRGFTGSVVVGITDRDGNILYVTNPQTYGVDGKRIPKPSDRTERWTDSVPSNIFSKVGGYAIIHTTNPRDRWREWLRTAREGATEIKAIYKQF